MTNTNWRDLSDARTGTHMRASPEVLKHLGEGGVLDVALQVKGRNPQASGPGVARATGSRFTANGLALVASAVLLQARSITAILISTREQWAAYHLGQRPETSPT